MRPEEEPRKRKLRRKNRYRANKPQPQPKPQRRRSHLRSEPDYPYYSDYAIENRDLQVDSPASEKPAKVTPRVEVTRKEVKVNPVPDRSKPEEFEVDLNNDFPDYVPVYHEKDPVQLEPSYEPGEQGQQGHFVRPYEESL